MGLGCGFHVGPSREVEKLCQWYCKGLSGVVMVSGWWHHMGPSGVTHIIKFWGSYCKGSSEVIVKLSPRALQPNLCVLSMQAKRTLTQPIWAGNAKGMPVSLWKHLRSYLIYVSKMTFWGVGHIILQLCWDIPNGAKGTPTNLYGLRMLRACWSHFGNTYNYL